MTKKELIEALKSVHTTGGSGSFNQLLEIVNEYGGYYGSTMEDYLWDEVVDEDTLDEMIQREAADGARRVYYFLKGIEWWDDYYHINGYGNIENLDEGYLEGKIDGLLERAEEIDEDEDEEDEDEEEEEEEEE